MCVCVCTGADNGAEELEDEEELEGDEDDEELEDEGELEGDVEACASV